VGMWEEMEDLKGEVWKDIAGYEGRYQISNLGRVKSVKRLAYNPHVLGDGCYRTVPERILKHNNNRGYHCVYIRSDNVTKVHRIHYLVARAFIGEPPSPSYLVIHLDGNKHNNVVENLKWVTPKEYSEIALSTLAKKPLSDDQKKRKSDQMKERLANNPEIVKRNSEHMKKIWADPEYKAAVSKKISQGWQKRVAEIEANKPPKEIYHVPDLPGEEWRDVKGYEGLYAVSNMGRVKGLHRDLPHEVYGTWHINERLLKPGLAGPGKTKYYSVSLHDKNGLAENRKVHRMVAEAFLPRIEGKDVVNHKDCNKLNNCVDNLEWCTSLENTRHAVLNNRMDWSKTKRTPVVNIETGEWFRTIQDAEAKYHVANGAIGHAVRNGKKSCGFHWKYAERQV